MKALNEAVRLLSSDDAADWRLRDVLENSLLAVQRWQKDYPRSLPPPKMTLFLSLVEKHYARKRVDHRQERRLLMHERLALAKLGAEVSEAELDAELARLFERRLAMMPAEELLALAEAKRVVDVDPGERDEPS